MHRGSATLSLEGHWENPFASGEAPYGRSLDNRFRYYSPELGRYVSADPIGQAGGVNLYSYVENNPLNGLDPFGLDWRFNTRTNVLSQTDSEGNVTNSWPANSGPHGLGTLPEGEYSLGGPPVDVPPDHPSQSSFCDSSGNCWWQPVTPNFPTDRSGFGIHPDGNVPGTAGCVGATDDDTSGLRDALAGDQGPLTVVSE